MSTIQRVRAALEGGKPVPMTEIQLVDAAKRYMVIEKNEAPMHVKVRHNRVDHGNGVLSMICVVDSHEIQETWMRTFTFRSGKIARMRSRRIRKIL